MEQSKPAIVLQRIVAVTLLLVCAVYLKAATGFSFGTWSSPKAGFMPTIVGILGILLSAANVVRVFRAGFAGGADLGASPKRALAFLAVLILYAGFLGVLGFLPATFLATAALLKVGEVRGIVVPIAVSACFSGGVWLLFGQVLQLPLP